MKVCSKIEEIKDVRAELGNKDLALVPTMGALHEGHLSLVRKAKSICENVCVSIFVNPTQFGEGEDYSSYPRTLDQDLKLLESEGVSLVFTPTPQIMYLNHQTYIQNPDLSSILCGLSRPTHFTGVLTVVAKLFNITQATHAVFGEKDYQQLKIIEKMVTDLNMPVKIIPSPIIREPSGLAKSSRNSYLTDKEKEEASYIYKSLLLLQDKIKEGIVGVKDLFLIFQNEILKHPLMQLDYLSILDKDLGEISEVKPDCRALTAVKVGKTRLIDNIKLC